MYFLKVTLNSVPRTLRAITTRRKKNGPRVKLVGRFQLKLSGLSRVMLDACRRLGRRRIEGRDQRRLFVLGGLEVALFYVAVAADVFRDAGDGHRLRQVIGRQFRQQR